MLTGVVVAVAIGTLQPADKRFGGYALVCFATGILCAWAEPMWSRRRWRAVATLPGPTGVLFVSRSRAFGAGGTLALVPPWLFIGKTIVQRFRTAILDVVAAVVLIGAVMTFAPTRIMPLTSFARLIGHEAAFGDLYVTRGEGDAFRSAPSVEAAAFAWATAVATTIVLLIGLYHEAHQGLFLWVFLGVGLAMRDRFADDRHDPG